LQTRSKTVGIVQQRFDVDKMKIRFVDVGGQRNERRKWIHAFDGVTSIMFIVSLSEYDQCLEEDRKQNRLTEALNLFKDISNDKQFKNVGIILFYNKNDLFTEKVKKIDLGDYFPEYKGGCKYDSALNFIKSKFEAAQSKSKRTFVQHVTTATNTENIKKVFDSCKAIIMKELLKLNGMA